MRRKGFLTASMFLLNSSILKKSPIGDLGTVYFGMK